MKAISDHLFLLIKSMTKAEKRYFTLQAKGFASNKKSNHLLLFELIQNQKLYDEAAIVEQLQGKKVARYLTTAKTQLKELILDSLHEFHLSSDKALQLKRKIHHAGILYEKGFVKESLSLLRKLKRQALREEEYVSLLELTVLKRKIQAGTELKGLKASDIELLYEEESENLQILQNRIDYWKLISDLYHFQFQKGIQRNKKSSSFINKLKKNKLLQSPEKAKSFRARMDYHHIQSALSFMQGDIAAAFESNQAYIDLFESNPIKLQQYPEKYLAVLQNFLLDCNGLKRYDMLQQGLAKMRALPEQKAFNAIPNLAERIFCQSYTLEMNVLLGTKDYSTAIATCVAVEEGLSKFENSISDRNKIILNYLLTYLYIINEDLKKAAACINQILFNADKGILQDLVALVHVLQLLVQYELKNEKYLDSLMDYSFRHLKYKDKLFKLEEVFFKHFKVIAFETSSRRLKKQFLVLKEDLLPLEKDPQEKIAFQYFDLIAWVDSKIERKSFAKVLSI